jgi:hypothetical protein
MEKLEKIQGYALWEKKGSQTKRENKRLDEDICSS